MRPFWHIVLGIVFSLYTATVLAQSVRLCCPDRDCPLAQCQQMGCLAQSLSIDSVAAQTIPLCKPTSQPVADAIIVSLPVRDEEVWTPPD